MKESSESLKNLSSSNQSPLNNPEDHKTDEKLNEKSFPTEAAKSAFDYIP